jgi:carbon-monoxide dehydrogenase large subunit
VYDSGDSEGQLEQAMLRSEWNSFDTRRRESLKRGRLRGIGCAAFIEPSGGGVRREEVAIRFDASGSATLYALAGSSGQGHETVFPEMAAAVLGIPTQRIRLRASDPAGPSLSGEGTIGSRSVIAHGGAFEAAARTVVRKGMELAATALEVAASDIEFEAGRYRVKGTDLGMGLEELARRCAGPAPHPLDVVDSIMPRRTFPGGVHVAEVEIDPETGVVELIAYTAVDDCGRAINPVLVEGQIHGGVVQGIGQVMGEQCVYDLQSGQLLSGSFMDYPMPRADEQPDMHVHDCSVPSPTNPLGVKGAGEAGAVGAVPALANAVMHALQPLGVHRLDLPYTPHKVWRAIRVTRCAHR